MRRILFSAALAAGLLSFTACDIEDWGDAGLGHFTADFHSSYPLNATGKVSVETFNGSIEISGWDQNTIDISCTKYGPTQSAADDLRVETDHTPDAVSVRVVRPSAPRNHLGARFVIKLPRGALLDRLTASNGSIRTSDGVGPARFRTSNGSIEVKGLRGALDAQTSNAAIELTDVAGDATLHTSNGRIRTANLKGALDATTSNGGVHAEVDRADRPVRIESSNGSVELTLPDGFSRDVRVSTSNSGITLRLPSSSHAHILARTSNSSISSDFDLNMRGEISKNSIDGTIGSGGPLIDLNTSNGGIRLVRGAAGI